MIQTTIQNFSAEKYSDLTACLPPLPEQEAIVGHIKEVIRCESDLESDIKSSIALLKERRSALITAAVTGQLDIDSMNPPIGEHSCA